MSFKKVGAGMAIVSALISGAGNATQQGARAMRVAQKNSRASITREVNRNHAIRKMGRRK